MSLSLIKFSGKQFCVILLIRILYSYLAVKVLDGLWYSGSGGYYIEFSLNKEIISIILFITLIYFYLRMKIESILKKTLLNVLVILYFIPLNASFSLNNLSYKYLILTSLYFLFIVLALSIVTKKEHYQRKRQSSFILEDTHLNVIFFLICISFICYKLFYNGLSLNLTLDTESVYANRSLAVEYKNMMSGSLKAYIITIFECLTSYVAPIYLMIALERKKIFSAIVAILCILAEFSISSGKATIFFVGIVIYIYWVEKKGGVYDFEKTFRYAVLSLLIFCCIEAIFFRVGTIYMYIVRRTMYIPAWLNGMYYDYFSTNEKLHWSQSAFLLQNIIPDNYSESVLELISNNYFNGYLGSANTGMFAEAYMQWGQLGIVIYPILFLIVFNSANKVYEKYGKGIVIVVIIDAAIQLTNIPLLRTDFLLSFGSFTILLWIVSKVNVHRRIRK